LDPSIPASHLSPVTSHDRLEAVSDMDKSLIWPTGVVVFLSITVPKPPPLKISLHLLRVFILLYSLVAMYPFYDYLVQKAPSWSGLELTSDEKKRIEGPPGHVVGMVIWQLLAFAQGLSYGRLQKLHNAVGYLGYAVLFWCMWETSTNAMFVFLPSKPALLASATLGREPTLWEIVAFANVFSIGLLLPVGVILHAYFALLALYGKKRNGRIHAHHMLCLMSWVVAPGVQRLIISKLWAPLNATPFENNEVIILIQVYSFFAAGSIFLAVNSLFYATLPVQSRGETGVEFMRRLWVVFTVWGPCACWVLGVDPWLTL
jgi:hypothetical protein